MASNKSQPSSGGPGKTSQESTNTSISADVPPADDTKKLTAAELVGKRVDLPIEAYLSTSKDPVFQKRPPGTAPGKPSNKSALVNVFKVTSLPTKKIHLYNVSVKEKEDKPSRGLVNKLWESSSVKDRIRSQNGGTHWIFNGDSLAWSLSELPNKEEKIKVDLDPESERDCVFTLVVKHSKAIQMSALQGYLNGSASWNFLDHALRQTPSSTLQLIGKNFYRKDQEVELDNTLSIVKGGFASFRISSIPGEKISRRLVVNADIANTAFWQPLGLLRTITELIPNDLKTKPGGLQRSLLPDISRGQQIPKPVAFQYLRRLIRLKFQLHFPGRPDEAQSTTIHTIKCFYFDENLPEGANAENVTFEKMVDGTSRKISVFDHFCNAHQYRINYRRYPLVETMKGAKFPLEVCKLVALQRFRYKLDPDQTNEMIKHAVTPPWVRKKDIDTAVNNLNWAGDPHLQAFGISISKNMLQTRPQMLGFPTIYYSKNTPFTPKDTKINLKDKKFFQSRSLNTVVFISFGNYCSTRDLESYSNRFKRAYQSQGGSIGQPWKAIHKIIACHDHAAFEAGMRKEFPSRENDIFFFFVVDKKNAPQYDRVKTLMDCKMKKPSQVLVHEKAKKDQAGYWANVCLKVHAKLGGTAYVTSKTLPKPLVNDTMMIGLDVSHGAPGSDQLSMAAMSVSLDVHTAFYGASCQTNGCRKEIVELPVMRRLLLDLLQHWVKTRRMAPRHLLFFRDGVSEGQFQQVLDAEVQAIKAVFRESQHPEPKVTVIVATKRHHIRAFMEEGGQKQQPFLNPGPGTLIEDLATHPQHWDFYLYSHRAIQGTARPVHYQVLRDEIGFDRSQLTNLIYHQCYQYCRCPTPVSLHPAVYYAHLASQRARAHIPLEPGPGNEAPSLNSIGELRETMWFV